MIETAKRVGWIAAIACHVIIWNGSLQLCEFASEHMAKLHRLWLTVKWVCCSYISTLRMEEDKLRTDEDSALLVDNLDVNKCVTAENLRLPVSEPAHSTA